jgi:hypothetical protein
VKTKLICAKSEVEDDMAVRPLNWRVIVPKESRAGSRGGVGKLTALPSQLQTAHETEAHCVLPSLLGTFIFVFTKPYVCLH